MKKFFEVTVFSIIALATSTALAFPGGHELTCQSAQDSGSKQVVTFHLTRVNSVGWVTPKFSVTVNGKK